MRHTARVMDSQGQELVVTSEEWFIEGGMLMLAGGAMFEHLADTAPVGRIAINLDNVLFFTIDAEMGA